MGRERAGVARASRTALCFAGRRQAAGTDDVQSGRRASRQHGGSVHKFLHPSVCRRLLPWRKARPSRSSGKARTQAARVGVPVAAAGGRIFHFDRIDAPRQVWPRATGARRRAARSALIAATATAIDQQVKFLRSGPRAGDQGVTSAQASRTAMGTSVYSTTRDSGGRALRER